MNNQITVRQRVDNLIVPAFEEQLTKAAPNGLKGDRVKAALLTAAMNNPDILKCSPESLRNAIMKSASDGLAPDGREAALVPFKGVAQYVPMYQGLIKRAKQMGELFSISCLVIYEKDEFSYIEGSTHELIHKPNILADDRGQKVGAYAVFRDKDGSAIHIEVMSRAEILKAKAVARASGVWEKWEDEMWRKTVIRRGLKYVGASEGLQELVSRDDNMFELERPPERPAGNPLAHAAGVQIEGEVIDEGTGEIKDSVSPADLGREHAIEGVTDGCPDHFTPEQCEEYWSTYRAVEADANAN